MGRRLRKSGSLRKHLCASDRARLKKFMEMVNLQPQQQQPEEHASEKASRPALQNSSRPCKAANVEWPACFTALRRPRSASPVASSAPAGWPSCFNTRSQKDVIPAESSADPVGVPTPTAKRRKQNTVANQKTVPHDANATAQFLIGVVRNGRVHMCFCVRGGQHPQLILLHSCA